MTLLYSNSIRNLMTNRGMAQGFSSPSVTIYSGVQPAASVVTSSWGSYNNTNSNLLWHAQSGLTLSVATSGLSIYGSALPSTIPVRNGTASWGIIWSGSVAYSAMGTSSIPNSSFIVVPVTDTSGNGVIRLQSTTLSTATTATIINLGFSIGY